MHKNKTYKTYEYIEIAKSRMENIHTHRKNMEMRWQAMNFSQKCTNAWKANE